MKNKLAATTLALAVCLTTLCPPSHAGVKAFFANAAGYVIGFGVVVPLSVALAALEITVGVATLPLRLL